MPSIPTNNRSPWRQLLQVQLLSLLPVVAMYFAHPNLTVGHALLVQVSCAVLLSRVVFRQPPWWSLVHLLFWPLIFVARYFGIAAHWWLLATIVCLAVFGFSFLGRVPLFVTNADALRALDEALPPEATRFIEFGCGTGTVLAHVAQRFPGTCIGIEAAWLPWLLARCRAWRSGGRFQVIYGNFWHWPCEDGDAVYSYLSPTPMPALWRKLHNEVSHAWLLSNRFPVPGHAPNQEIPYGEDDRVFVWKIGS